MRTVTDNGGKRERKKQNSFPAEAAFRGGEEPKKQHHLPETVVRELV
jgi:hypothetical protein